MKKILILEDEPELAEMLAQAFHTIPAQTWVVLRGDFAMQQIREFQPDLILCDWMLPELNGLDVLRQLRRDGKLRQIPVLMVTAKSEPEDLILALEVGADDFVSKPFEWGVLLARARALLRRAEDRALVDASVDKLTHEANERILEKEGEVLLLGNLEVRPDFYQVRVNQESIDCTPSEYKLLIALLRMRGRVCTRDQLIQMVQGDGVSVVDRAIDTHVFGLRKKLRSAGELIETVRGVGYRVRYEFPDQPDKSEQRAYEISARS